MNTRHEDIREYVCQGDKEFFESNPDAAFRVRSYVPGEWPVDCDCLATLVMPLAPYIKHRRSFSTVAEAFHAGISAQSGTDSLLTRTLFNDRPLGGGRQNKAAWILTDSPVNKSERLDAEHQRKDKEQNDE